MMTGQALRGIAYGPLLGHQQSVPRAELFAVIQILRCGILPLRMRAGCVGAVGGVQKAVG
eukprot:5305145-Pyramimonas_sp.AAC.1